MEGLFQNCCSLKSIPNLAKWVTNNVSHIGYLFCGCESLLSLPDISIWNIDKVKNIN